MSKFWKIISVLTHKPAPVAFIIKEPEEYISRYNKAGYIRLNRYPYWVGFFRDFHHKLALEVMKRTDEFEIECWRPYGASIDREYETVFEGVKHRVFPSRYIRIPRTGYWHWSKPMLKALRAEAAKGKKILLHLNDGHTNFANWLLLKLKSVMPTIYMHRGYWFANFDFKYRRKNPFLLLLHSKEKKALKYIDYYFTGSMIEYKYLTNELHLKEVSFFMDGVDFDYFKPGDKIKAKRDLGIHPSKKVVLSVNRLTFGKGIDLLIDVHNILKRERDDFVLINVGSYNNIDPLYDYAKSAGIILYERMPEPELLRFFQAADFYVLPMYSKLAQMFSGIGTSTIQALACNLPVLSKNLIHFPGTEEERKSLGIQFEDRDDFIIKFRYMLDNYHLFKEARGVTEKYFDFKVTINQLTQTYKQVIEKYYKKCVEF
ncbi:MAG: glycosyltransferase [Ignavibacteria bacterium]